MPCHAPCHAMPCHAAPVAELLVALLEPCVRVEVDEVLQYGLHLVRLRHRCGSKGLGLGPAELHLLLELGLHLWCHGTRYVRHARGWCAYGVRPWRNSCPVPQVRTLRRRLVRVARTYSTEAPGRTVSIGLAPPLAPAPRRAPARRRPWLGLGLGLGLGSS